MSAFQQAAAAQWCDHRKQYLLNAILAFGLCDRLARRSLETGIPIGTTQNTDF